MTSARARRAWRAAHGELDILATHLVAAAKRLFGIPNFRLYALADGIRELYARSPRRSRPGATASPQLTLGFA